MKKFFLIFFACLFLVLCAVFYYFGCTSYGAQRLAYYFFPRYVPAEEKKLGSVEGSLNTHVVLRDLEFLNLLGFPKGSTIKIQAVTIIPDYRDLRKFAVFIENGRLFMPNSDPIVFRGRYDKELADFNVYTNLLSVEDLVELIRLGKGRKFSGFIRNADLNLKGPPENLQITSHFFAENITNPDFALMNSDGDLNLTVSGIKSRQNQVYGGYMTFYNGQLVARKIKFDLIKTKVQVGSAIPETIFDIKATAQVEDVKITLTLKGTRSNPHIELNSFPPYPQDTLFLMLATGRGWSTMGSDASEEQMAADMASKMMDFFLLASWPGDLAQKFGILDASVKFDSQTRGIGVRKRVLNNVTVGYEIDQQYYQQTNYAVSQQQAPQVKQVIAGEVKLNGQLSVSAQKELQREDRSVIGADPTTTTKPDDQVLLKFKKNF